jgi:hypothetical protein
MRGSAHPIQVIAGARASGLVRRPRKAQLPGVDCRASLAHRQIAAAFSLHGTAREDPLAAISRVLEHPVS